MLVFHIKLWLGWRRLGQVFKIINKSSPQLHSFSFSLTDTRRNLLERTNKHQRWTSSPPKVTTKIKWNGKNVSFTPMVMDIRNSSLRQRPKRCQKRRQLETCIWEDPSYLFVQNTPNNIKHCHKILVSFLLPNLGPLEVRHVSMS